MKKIKFAKYITIIALSLTVLNSSGAFAQTGFDEDVDDEAPVAAPINENIYFGLFGGAFLGYFLLRRREKIS